MAKTKKQTKKNRKYEDDVVELTPEGVLHQLKQKEEPKVDVKPQIGTEYIDVTLHVPAKLLALFQDEAFKYGDAVNVYILKMASEMYEKELIGLKEQMQDMLTEATEAVEELGKIKQFIA